MSRPRRKPFKSRFTAKGGITPLSNGVAEGDVRHIEAHAVVIHGENGVPERMIGSLGCDRSSVGGRAAEGPIGGDGPGRCRR